MTPVLRPAFWLLFAFVACDSSIDVNDYDQSCSVADDCVVITAGDDVCCSCANAAINKRDLDAFLDDKPDCSNAGCDIGCVKVEAWCNAGKCDLR